MNPCPYMRRSDRSNAAALAVWLVITSPLASLAADTKDLKLEPGWTVVGTQHVRDSAERDLAVLDAGQPLSAIRVCAAERSIRLRNATAWLPKDKRQKLWLPLVIEAGRCSDPIKVQGAPQKVTHIAFEYEALGADWAGGRLIVAGRVAAPRR
jgi:hypothetical protein